MRQGSDRIELGISYASYLLQQKSEPGGLYA